MVSCLADISYAAFPVKALNNTTAAAVVTVHHQPSRIARLLHINDTHKPHDQRPGWPGVAAVVCGAVGFFPGAIVFGIIGLGKRYKNHGFAIAGIILGVIDIVLLVLIVAAIISVFQVSMSGVI